MKIAQPEHYKTGCWCIQCRKAVVGTWVVRADDRPSDEAFWVAQKYLEATRPIGPTHHIGSKPCGCDKREVYE
jgi:hypothetical protein